jgi:hypothetical protein
MFRLLALASLLAFVPAHATSVDVVAVGTLNNYADPNGLLPFPQPDSGTIFTLTFSYDSETPDINPDGKAGEYRGAISTISLSIGDYTSQSFSDNWVVMLDDVGNPIDGYADLWLASTFNDSPLRSSFGLVLIDFGASALTSDALVAPSFPFPPWRLGFLNYSIEDRSSPDFNDWVTLATADALVNSVTVTAVPTPPAVLLFGSALGVMAWLRRKATS